MFSYSKTGKEANFSHIRTAQLLENNGEYESVKQFYTFNVLSVCLPIGLDKTLISLSSIFAWSNSFSVKFSYTSMNFRHIFDKVEDEKR